MNSSKGRGFTLRRTVQSGQNSDLYVNNVPVGTYRLTGRLLQGGNATPLHFKGIGPYARESFGLAPKKDSDAPTLTFRPGSAKAGMPPTGHGNWSELDILVSR